MRGEPDSDRPALRRAGAVEKLAAAAAVLREAYDLLAEEQDPVACVAEGHVQSARMSTESALDLLRMLT